MTTSKPTPNRAKVIRKHIRRLAAQKVTKRKMPPIIIEDEFM